MSNPLTTFQRFLCEPVLINPQALIGLEDFLNKILIARPDGTDPWSGKKVAVPQMEINGNVAVIPVIGTIGQGLDEWDRGAGMVDVDDIGRDIEDADANGKVTCKVLYLDTPGGSACGLPELSCQIENSNKPTYAFTRFCASGGYWLACSCDEIVGTTSSLVGCIGAYMAFVDRSKMYLDFGIKVQLISSGKYKGMGFPGTSLTPEQTALLQGEINTLANTFKTHVSRRMTRAKLDDMEGQMFDAASAVSKGLMHRVVQSKSEFISSLTTK